VVVITMIDFEEKIIQGCLETRMDLSFRCFKGNNNVFDGCFWRYNS